MRENDMRCPKGWSRWAAVFFLLAGLVIAGCGSDDDDRRDTRDAVCEGITCSGNGICRAVQGDPQCACNSGFVPSGLNCIKESDGMTDNNTQQCSASCSNRECGPDPICGDSC